MAIEFNVQSDDGTVTDANAYITLDQFDQYWENHGKTYADGTDSKMVAIIRATEYVDQRFQYEGLPLEQDQPTEFPRSGATDCRGDDATGIPVLVDKATAEYAGRYLDNSSLQSDVTDMDALAGRTIMEKVGPIEARYAAGIAQTSFPFYPTADQILKSSCLVISANIVWRS